MRILTYNIHGCVGKDGHEDPNRIIEVINESNADIIALQEVHSSDAQDLNFLLQLKTLPYQSIIYGKTMRKVSADYGNLLMLRKPPTELQRIELPCQRGEPRGAIIADTSIDDMPFRIIATHLDLRASDRNLQYRKLIELVQQQPAEHPCILFGDFNEWFPWRKGFRALTQQFDHLSTNRTFPIYPRLLPLDRIAIKGRPKHVEFSTVESATSRVASDHIPLTCDLSF